MQPCFAHLGKRTWDRYKGKYKMVDEKEVLKTLNKYFTFEKVRDITITIADDGKVSVTGEVRLKRKLSHLPVQFDTVDGGFRCSQAGLQSLHGSPSKVERYFNCSFNKLLSLEGGPDRVGDYFSCGYNPLESLKGAPSYVGKEFYCDYNPSLPLLRTLVAKQGVRFLNTGKYPIAEEIQDVLNQFKGQGKRGVPACMVALNNLQKELGIDIRANIKW